MAIKLRRQSDYLAVREALATPELEDSQSLASEEAFSFMYDNEGELEECKALTDAQRRLLAVCSFYNAYNSDGLRDGVCYNNPHVIPLAAEAAKALSMTALVAAIDAIRAAVPVDQLIASEQSERDGIVDDDELAERLESVEALLEAEELDGEIHRTVSVLLAKHPGEFFTLPAN